MSIFSFSSFFRVTSSSLFLFLGGAVCAEDGNSLIEYTSNKILGDSYFYNQKCTSENEESIFCLKDYFFGKSDWYPVGVVSMGYKPETVNKIVNGMEGREAVVLDTYEFNKLIHSKKATEIAIVSSDRNEYGIFKIPSLLSGVGMCKNLINLSDKNIFHYEDSGCNLSGSDYSFFGVVENGDKDGSGEGMFYGKRSLHSKNVAENKNYKDGFYLLSNKGSGVIGYRMPKGFSSGSKFYLMIR